ncbi:MAG TPA: DUF885 domain-containing protein [Candidatus Eremiobacteraceae bacterium]|nr:DUF885 domain-containing protein [Candidatus Eremiobacteraceae bacterium]
MLQRNFQSVTAFALCSAVFFHAAPARAAAAAPAGAPTRAAAVEELAHRYYMFTWMASPTSATDNGLHLADNRLADFSDAANRAYGAGLQRFRDELAALAPGGTSIHDQVNYLLLRSDIEGDYWSRTFLRPRERNPAIYEEECTNGIFLLLRKPFASNAVRARDAAGRMRQCNSVLLQGEHNLTEAVREFGVVASQETAGADPLFTQSLEALTPGLTPAQKADLYAARDRALVGLHNYKHWVDVHLPQWHSGGFAVGKEQYDWMLRRVLLLPWDSDQLAQMARFELARDRALAAWEKNHEAFSSGTVRTQPQFTNKVDFLRYYESQTSRVVAFIKSHHLVTIPPYIGAFRIVELPRALAPIYPGGFMNPPGTFDRDQTGFYFVPNYDPHNTSFFAAQARQAVLPVLAHEGIPGHFLQFSIAYKNPDFIRKVHGDGVFAEGWAFYGEEMLMRTGLYDDDPAARTAVIHLMRHRATRVLVDIGLATGAMTLPQAIEFFKDNAGIDRDTAYGEGTRFAMGPGQAIDYLTGKSQIESLLAEDEDHAGARFSLGAFHDKLLSFGTVPYSTIAWEWLGDSRWIARVRDPIAPLFATPGGV